MTLTTANRPPRSSPSSPPPADDKFYQPRGAARELFPCRRPEILIEGPAGTGKTRAVLEKVNRWMLNCPGSRALLVRKTRASMTESVLVTYEAKVLPENTDLYPATGNTLRRVRQSYSYPNGSSVVVGGMDNAGRIMSTEYDLIAAFEATELAEDDWEKLTTRLRNGVMPFQQAIADCNPTSPSHWLNARAKRGLMARLLSRHTDNPGLHDGAQWTRQGQAYLDTLERLSGARKLRLLKGIWAAQEGLVYDDFDANVHLIEPFAVPASWRRIRVIDFGHTNPFVCQWWAIDGDGRMFLYREIYHTKRLVEDHAPAITRLSEGESIEATVSDHDAEDRATLDRRGIRTVPASKAIAPGIEAVAARLRPAGDGRPRLFIFRDCLVERDEALVTAKLPTCTAEEIDGYCYPKPKEGKEAKEDPLKLNDHGMDAMRYACMYRPLKRVAGEVLLMS